MSLHASFTVRRLRLISGLVMFAYIAIHLLNHALGIISLALAESGLRLEMAFWRSPPATLLLYGAAAIHFSLALWTLYSRREWRLPRIEILRLASGFSFPLLLIGHAVTTRLGYTLFAIKPSYAAIITNLLMAGTQVLARGAGRLRSLVGRGRLLTDGGGGPRHGTAASGQPPCGDCESDARGLEGLSDDGLSWRSFCGLRARPAASRGAAARR